MKADMVAERGLGTRLFPDDPLFWDMARTARAYKSTGCDELDIRYRLTVQRIDYCDGWYARSHQARQEIHDAKVIAYQQGLKAQAENFWQQIPDYVIDRHSLHIVELTE